MGGAVRVRGVHREQTHDFAVCGVRAWALCSWPSPYMKVTVAQMQTVVVYLEMVIHKD